MALKYDEKLGGSAGHQVTGDPRRRKPSLTEPTMLTKRIAYMEKTKIMRSTTLATCCVASASVSSRAPSSVSSETLTPGWSERVNAWRSARNSSLVRIVIMSPS
jgi:hypothetical protein